MMCPAENFARKKNENPQAIATAREAVRVRDRARRKRNIPKVFRNKWREANQPPVWAKGKK
jgi:hypothetical protein